MGNPQQPPSRRNERLWPPAPSAEQWKERSRSRSAPAAAQVNAGNRGAPGPSRGSVTHPAAPRPSCRRSGKPRGGCRCLSRLCSWWVCQAALRIPLLYAKERLYFKAHAGTAGAVV